MDTLVKISQPIAAELEQYKELFSTVMSHGNDFLGGALNYIKQRKGKLMRPMMLLLMAKEHGEVGQKALISAGALEMLHTASLIHDDVVDESGERRGQASTNRAYGNQVAVLLGDYILSLLLRQTALTGDLRIVETVSSLGGTLSEGEIFQLSNIERQEVLEEEYYRIIRHKTAALFAACAKLGALSSNADETDVERAEKFGEIVGTCFQIRDDIFDYYDDNRIGKPTGNDLMEGKFTLPAIYAINKCADEKIWKIVEKVKKRTASPDEIADIVEFTKAHGGIEYARNVMDEYRSEALSLLHGFSNVDVRHALTLYLNYVIERDI